MFEWIVKKVILSKVNRLLGDYQGDVVKIKGVLAKWTARLEKALACFNGLVAKLDDNQLTAEECEQAAKEIAALVRGW